MSKKQIQYAIIFFTLFIDMVGFGIIIPILPRYAEYFGATSFQLGMIVAVYSLAQFVMLPIWGKLSDRIGRKPVLLLSVFGTAIGYLMMGFSQSIIMMIIARAIDGGAGGNMGTAQAYVSDITAPEERSKAMGVLGSAFGFGFVIGPALGGFISYRYGIVAPMFFAGGLALLNALLIGIFLPESLRREEKTTTGVDHQKSSLWKNVDKKIYLPALCTFFFFITGFAIITTVFSLFVYYRYHFNEQQTGWVYTMEGMIAIILEGALFGMLSKKWGDRRLVILGSCFTAVGFFFLPLTAHVRSMVFFFAMVAMGDSLLTPGLPGIISRSVSSEWQGAAFGFFQSVGSLGRLLGPLIAGYFLAIDLHGPIEAYARTAFFVAAGLLVGAFFCSLKIPKKIEGSKG
ncbi:MAG: MFS transporter [Chthoniobacterales bacterium]